MAGLFEHFTLIPSIDLKDRAVVRLRRGDFNQVTIYGHDPDDTARRFASAGASMIHVVDLDGAAAGEPRNLAAIGSIRKAVPRCHLDVSGGLRTIDAVRAAFAAGADRIALGSAAFLNPELLAASCREFPGRIFGSLDVRDGRLAIRGWREKSQLDVDEAARRFREAGVAAVIYTDIARDGVESGVDAAKCAALAASTRLKVIASGGVASLDDLRALRQRFSAGVVGAISGRAIYEGRFTIEQGLAACGQLDA